MSNINTTDLDHIFHPESVSIIGASSREGSFGQLYLSGFIKMGFKNIYPVHPRDKELLGLKAYPSILEIPYDIDLAVLLVPQSEASRVVQECIKKKVKGIILFAAGYGEKGAEGRKIEIEMARLARQNGCRIIGSNTNGLYCPASRLLTFPSSLLTGGLPSESGGLSILGQSGSFNDYLSIALTQNNIRLSKAVSCGNECDLTSIDFLEYFGQDQETRMIAGYMEGIRDGRKFFELCKDISSRKPIILWKGGITETGAKAALAHTGALAGARQVWEAMLKQCGVINVRSFEEMVDCILAFYMLPLPKGKKLAILSGMGGTNIGTTDNCLLMGLEIAKYSDTTYQKLNASVPAAGTAIGNPMDIGVGSLINPDLYGQTAKILAEDENVDMILVIAAPENPRIIESLAEASKAITKPLAIALFDLPDLVWPQAKYLLSKNIPVYRDPKRAGLALSKLAEYSLFISKIKT